MKIAFLFNEGRAARLQSVKRKNSPSDFYYGAIEFAGMGHYVRHFEFKPNVAVKFPYNIVNILLSRGILPYNLDGGLVAQLLEVWDSLKEYNLIIPTTSGLSFALSLLKQVKKLDVPVIALHCGLLNYLNNIIDRKLTEIFLRESENVLFGNGEFYQLSKLYPKIINRLHVCQYGIDLSFWYKDLSDNISRMIPDDKEFVLSVGNDARRDWHTLLNASNRFNTKLIIISSRSIDCKKFKNVSLISGDWSKDYISDSMLRSFYSRAKCVVITLEESFQPSGQSVCLQAMACGTPVVITKTKGFWDERKLIDEENILFVEPHNPEDVSRKVNCLLEKLEFSENLACKGREVVQKNFGIDKLASEISKIFLSVHSKVK